MAMGTIGDCGGEAAQARSDDEKRMVCTQTRFASVSVSQVARGYDVNGNQVFNWLKNPCFAAGH